MRPQRMKLIGLHGHLQSAKRMKGQTNALMRHLKKMGVEVVFIDAPFICPDGPEESPFRTWVQDDSIAEAHRVVLEAKAANPDAVGFFAFSMGAMLAPQCAAHAATHADSPFAWVRIIVAASAPYPHEGSPLGECLPCRSEVPVLFVIGEGDEIAPPDSQRRYLESFPNHTVFSHEGGHYIPSARQYIQNYADFFEKYKDLE